jgi:hypothetical protein
MPDTPATTRAPKFPLRRYEVEVGRWGTGVYLATSRGKALADAWRSDAFNGYTFGEFLKLARCRLSPPHHQPKPDIITVSGEECWGLGHNGQYVLLVRFGGDHVLYSHPLDVLPVSYRPKAYQTEAA